MALSGGTELLDEWEMDDEMEHNDDDFDLNEKDSWVSGGDHETFQDAESEDLTLRAAPYNWRQQRDTISPLEGAHQENLDDERVKTEQTVAEVNETINLQNISRERQTSLDQDHQSGGDTFQQMDGGPEDESYYYDEDLTRSGNNPNSEMRSRTHSNTDLIFRDSSVGVMSDRRTFFRYIFIAVFMLTIGFALGYIIAKATNTQSPVQDSSTTVFSTTQQSTKAPT